MMRSQRNVSKSTSDRRNQQNGGNFSKTVAKLAVPAFFTAGAYYLNKKNEPESSVARRQELVGGSFKGALLNTINDLIVPLGLMAGAHFLSKTNNSQHGGKFESNQYSDLHQPLGFSRLVSNKIVNNMQGGSPIPIIGDTYLGKWLETNSVKILSPSTLLPLGLIFILYMSYRRYANTNPENVVENEVVLDAKPNINDLSSKSDLDKYMRLNNINKLNPNSMFPYALAMGPDMFNKYVNDEEKELFGGDNDESNEEFGYFEEESLSSDSNVNEFFENSESDDDDLY